MKIPTKKKIKVKPQPTWPVDPTGAEFCAWFWQSNQGWDWILGNAPTPDLRTQWITESYPISPDELWLRHQDPSEAIGVGFKGYTRYCLIDIDRGSKYHPSSDLAAYQSLLEALRAIGLMQPVVLRSTWSGGLHLYYPFPKKVSSFGVACAIKWCLFDAGILLEGGQVETFPNVKSYSKSDFVNYKAHRLPLQIGSGSALLDGCLEPYSVSVPDLLDEFANSSKQQDLELLERASIEGWNRQRLSRGYGSSKRGQQWRIHLETRLTEGWTAFSQSNALIKDAATYGRVFLCLNGQPLIDYVLEQVTAAPGYERFCRHQHEIKRRVIDWCRAVERYYWPYGTPVTRKGTYKENFNDCPTPENNIVNFPSNFTRSAQAEERVKQAIAVLEESGNLPPTATARAIAVIETSKKLSGIGVSQTTLHKPKFLALWHPNHYSKPCVIPLCEPVPTILEEAETSKTPETLITASNPKSPEPIPDRGSEQNYTSSSYMKGLGGDVFPDAPQAQSEEHIAIQGGAGGNPQARPSALAQLTNARIRAAGVAREAVKLARLSITGTDAERREAEHLAGEIARIQYYWTSGIDQLRREAQEWSCLHPGVLLDIPPAPRPTEPRSTVLPVAAPQLVITSAKSPSSPLLTPHSPPETQRSVVQPEQPWYAERMKPRAREESPFKPGERVLYEGEEYIIVATTHTHSQLKGIPKAVPNFGLTSVSGQDGARGDAPLRTLP